MTQIEKSFRRNSIKAVVANRHAALNRRLASGRIAGQVAWRNFVRRALRGAR